MIVTIDGPAGAGKSSIARQVADHLEFDFLDTGAMYRAVTLGAIRAQIDWHDTDALVAYATNVQLDWDGKRIFLEGEDVTQEIRTPTVTAAIRYLADLPQVRCQLSALQRRVAAGRNIVTEGRDQGSDVFPDAQCKIFLTASSEERARRRQQQLAAAGR
ncbi:MAG: (d)CMP kinase, partial [Pirellulales bacterium]|nr:(d)CMP kinase [Pirellulales bacterium]